MTGCVCITEECSLWIYLQYSVIIYVFKNLATLSDSNKDTSVVKVDTLKAIITSGGHQIVAIASSKGHVGHLGGLWCVQRLRVTLTGTSLLVRSFKKYCGSTQGSALDLSFAGLQSWTHAGLSAPGFHSSGENALPKHKQWPSTGCQSRDVLWCLWNEID